MSVLFGLYISKLRIREIGGTSVRDQYGRTVDYMRVSITDRCNLRCRYCMPEGIELVSMEEILTYEEIERICTAAAKTGKISRTFYKAGSESCLPCPFWLESVGLALTAGAGTDTIKVLGSLRWRAPRGFGTARRRTRQTVSWREKRWLIAENVVH